jgi:hypothetical protein
MARVVSQPTLIIVITEELVAERLSSVSGAEAELWRPQVQYDDSMKRGVALWLAIQVDTRHVLPSTGSRIFRPSYSTTKCVFIGLPIIRFTDEAYIFTGNPGSRSYLFSFVFL